MRHTGVFEQAIFFSMILHKLVAAKLIHLPGFLADNTQMLTVMGSDAYGVSSGGSDLDLYGFCIPPKEMIFPHLAGEIFGFGRQVQRFEQWSEHHIPNPDGKTVEYDITVFSIVKYFQLCMDNNPNMIDSLFTPRRCVVHMTALGEHVRENRKRFLHKGAFHKFKGYAYAQFSKYQIERREALKPILVFQTQHNISNKAIINSLQREFARRGLVHAKWNP